MVNGILNLNLLTLLIINYKFISLYAQIEHSFDLNCDFDKNNLCLWHNSNVTWDHTSDWIISESILNITSINKQIAPMPLNNGFIYTNGTNHGLNSALLVSDVISCQLGGAEIKYWYYKTQMNSKLEICIRQPPGSLNLLQQKCYDGVQAVQANQWVHQKIELPPSSQPFEILIRAYFIHPDDIIAIDKISYEAALCGSTHGQISVITIDKWNEVKDEINNREENIKPMLVIADSINQKDDSILEGKYNDDNNNTTIDQKTVDIGENKTKINGDTLPNFLDVIHDVSPLLTMLWKSLQQQPSNLYSNQLLSLPSASTLINSNIPIVAKASKTLPIDESTNVEEEVTSNNENNLLNSPMKYEVPIINKNIYIAKINQSNGIKKSLKQLPTKVIYPSNFHPLQIKTKSTTPIIPIDFTLPNTNHETMIYNRNDDNSHILSNYKLKKKTIIKPKTLYEEGTIEKEEKIPDIVMSKPNYVVVSEPNNNDNMKNENDIIKGNDKMNFIYNKLSQQSVNVDDITRQLTPEMISELQMLSNFDDLESLTEGMDLSLLTKQGGFNILRQQFLERLIQKKLDKDLSKPYKSIIQGSTKNDGSFILDDEYKSFGIKTYVKDKDKTKFDYDYDDFFIEKSPCSEINCNFNDDNFCKWVSLNDDSDIGLIFPTYDMNIKEWSLGINSLGNSVTGILNNQKNRKNYIFAGETDNPNDIFILITQKKVFFKEPSRIVFDYYHAGIHGEIKMCLDDFNTCPFSYSSRNLTINARKWQKGEMVIPEISRHRILIYANGLVNNYFVGFDNIRLTQLSTLKAAQCS